MKKTFKLLKSIFFNKYSISYLTYLVVIIVSKVSAVGSVIRILDGDKETIYMFREMFGIYYLRRGIKIWILVISLIGCINLFYYLKNKRRSNV